MNHALVNRLARKAAALVRRVALAPAQWRLERSGSAERLHYEQLAAQCATRYARIRTHDTGETTGLWRDFNERLERSLLPRPPWDFLRDPVISATMVMTKGGANLAAELAALRAFWPPETLRTMVRENALGSPRLANAELLTSHNSIHHAHHIARFLQATSVRPDTIGTVVEWGGGYGNLAKLWRRMKGCAPTWVIIDTPVLAVVQWLYLAAILGEDTVRLMEHSDTTLLHGGITIIPLQFVKAVPPTADLFVSTWAISESPRELQDMVVERSWFGARHLLLGYQDSNAHLPNAGRIGALAASVGATIEDLPALPGQHYAFR
ncbi:MAG: hypothetical protein IT405_02970 [Candidatus Yanofskybacteria bacterium]|nr:hypothetical protein [Candidatus Yanofskybacteria bacterium]